MIKLLFCLWSCELSSYRHVTSMNDDTAYWAEDYSWDGPPGSEGNPVYNGDIDLTLSSGYLTSAGIFHESDASLFLNPSGDWAFLQVGAFIKNAQQYNLDLVRISFTSDRVEWICGQPSGSWIFLSQEECQAAGYYCDPVVAGEGESGLFDAGGGEKMAVINAHCTHAGLPYSYTVEAHAYDFSSWEEVVISKIATIIIHCREQ